MSASLVLTVIGPDRPGIVEAISQAVLAHDGNWLESRMARLAGQFAGILRASVPEARVAALVEALRELESRGLRVVVERSDEAPVAVALRGKRLELVGADRPGIVLEISRALAERGVNVEELETECVSAPMSGESLFRARALLQVPENVSSDELRDALEKIAHDLMADLSLDDAPEAEP